MTVRPYPEIASALGDTGSREERMRAVVDALWAALRHRGVSWVGFYLADGDDPDTALVLGPCRDSPACSPIGLHGVCGQAYIARESRVIEDVRACGEAYIPCDPRDRSEVVIPLIEDDVCWGVLDLDSHETSAFDERDVEGLMAVLRSAGM